MKLIYKYYQAIYLKRKKIGSLALILLLISLFENCGGEHLSRSSISSSNQAADTSGLSGGDSASVLPIPTTTTGPLLPLAELLKICKGTTTNPDITGLSLNEVALNSGLADVSSGNTKSPSIKVTADRGISDPTTFAKYGCDSQYSLSLKCSVVADDPSRPISITNVFDATGNDMLKSAPVKPLADLAKNSILGARCNVGFGAGKNEVNFIIEPNSKADERCVQGSFWMKLTVTNQVAGLQGSNTSPTTQYLKVNVNNGCWAENRLQDSAGNLSPVINFGTAVALGNGWAAILAPTDDSATTIDIGSIHMYKFDGTNWVQKEKLMVGDALARESLNSVALLGDTMIVGSPYRNKMGATFFYQRSGDTWNLIQRVDPPDQSQQYQDFGFSVALTNGYVFVSSPSYMVGGMAKAGSVAVYSYSSAGMSFIKTLNGLNANSAFGYSLAASGATLAVGAPQAIGKESLAEGSVYLFSENGGAWDLNSAATKKGSSLAEKFGATVALLGNKLVVGSPNYTANDKVAAGRATFYSDYTVAAPTKTWNGADAAGNMGQGLALSTTGVYVASPLAATRTGYVDHYLYSNLDAVYYHAVAYNETSNSAFGWSLSAAGNHIAIGARLKNDPNDNSGAAYIYRYK